MLLSEHPGFVMGIVTRAMMELTVEQDLIVLVWESQVATEELIVGKMLVALDRMLLLAKAQGLNQELIARQM